ncbi:MAG: helix-turn-helix domain-containing protein [candidate division WS1 bacterium]|jgi:excisionase family DNA binding protein|nr:helix-turn-helix domain-containing protein [candidate division WS1 bacterium]
MEDRSIINTKQCAELLGVSEERVRTLAREEKIPAARIGGHWRYSRRQVIEWAESIAIPRGWIPATGAADRSDGE